jgi:hypothetical protein
MSGSAKSLSTASAKGAQAIVEISLERKINPHTANCPYCGKKLFIEKFDKRPRHYFCRTLHMDLFYAYRLYEIRHGLRPPEWFLILIFKTQRLYAVLDNARTELYQRKHKYDI